MSTGTTRQTAGRKRLGVLSRGLWALLGAWAACGCAASPGLNAERLYRTVREASVFVLADGRHRGSGFFADSRGLIVTAAHMVKGQTDGIEVVSPVAGRLEARPVAIDLGHDVALLRVGRRKEPYPALRIAERIPPPGTEILLFGDAAFQHHLLLAGSVSAVEPTYCHNPGVGGYTRVFFAAGASPNGTSGGCWVDREARVVGVQSGYLNISTKVPAGIAMVSPPEAVRRLLATRRSPAAATLGSRLDELWTQPKGFIARFPKGSAGVVTVVPAKDGPAAKAGLKKGSLITAIDGKPVAYIQDVMAVVRSKKPGEEVTLEVLDPDKKPKRLVKVRLGTLR